jgi:hypothetical protein
VTVDDLIPSKKIRIEGHPEGIDNQLETGNLDPDCCCPWKKKPLAVPTTRRKKTPIEYATTFHNTVFIVGNK